MILHKIPVSSIAIVFCYAAKQIIDDVIYL